MKSSTTKKLFAFIITVMMFSVSLLHAQCKRNEIFECYTSRATGEIICHCVKAHHVKLSASGSQPGAISFSLDKPEKISAKIYDMTGRLVKTLPDEIFERGEHELQWDAAGANAGIYMVQFNAGSNSEMKKVFVIK